MPRIRKKTSNRVKLKDRASIQKKVKETRRKRAKSAKKNVQWKSKTPKDPGIPNDFPYKDEILAEVAEQRRAAAEEKEKKRAEKQRVRMGVIAQEDDVDSVMEDDTERPGRNKLDVGADAINGLAVKSINAELRTFEVEDDVSSEDEEEEDVPTLFNRGLATLKSVLDEADVVLEVLDARDPLESRSQFLEQYATEQKKKLMLVLNKIDTCPREAVSSWISQLRTQQPATFLFKSSTTFLPVVPGKPSPKSKGKEPINDAFGVESIVACLGQWEQEKDGDPPLTVAVVGIANVGKSSFINTLSKRSALPVYTQATTSRGATTTELPQELTIEIEGHSLRIIDTPGIAFTYDSEAEQSRVRDILLRSRGRIDRLKDPAPPIVHLVPRCNHEDLMLLYSLPAFTKGDETAFLTGVARAHQMVKKRGELDLAGAARTVLRDWSTGKFARYAVPLIPSTTAATKPPVEWLAKLYANDEKIFESLTPRKELRKSVGLVRLTPGAVDSRSIDFAEDWPALDDSGDEGSDGEEDTTKDEVEDLDGDADSDDDEEMDDDEAISDEEAEEIVVEPTLVKRKRKAGPLAVAPPPKRVAFAPKVMKASSKPRTKPRAKGDASEPVGESAPVVPPSAMKRTKTPTTTSVQQKTAKVEVPKKIANKAASKLKERQEDGAYDFTRFFKK